MTTQDAFDLFANGMALLPLDGHVFSVPTIF